MKKSFRLLLILPLLLSGFLASCSNPPGFTAPVVRGKVMNASGSEPLTIPHGITAL